MNVSELARQLRINTKDLLDILPRYGFDIGRKAIKIDNTVAQKVIKQWKYIRRDLDEKQKKELEEKRMLEKEMRKQSGHTVVLPSRLTVREFAEKLSLPVTQIITELMRNGILANQNQNIDYDTAAIIGSELGFNVSPSEQNEGTDVKEAAREEALTSALAKSSHLEKRPPVIVVMGHVDHGKTKLLDTIRHTNIIDTEAGGITQHMGAYQTIWRDPKTKKERALTFIDTPGHEAFTVMRSRGAKVADIAILVVAGDDGVKPQTEEVIQIIKAAKLPFIVAINKIDKEGADPKRVKNELSQHGLIPEEWGGDTPMVEISAKQKINIDKLLDVLILVADMNEEKIQADPNLPAVGTVIESNVDKGMGPVATILIQAGTLRKKDPLVVNGEVYGVVRAMKNYRGEEVDSVEPGMPARIIGFKVAPEVGDILDVSKAGGAEKINLKDKRLRQTGAENSVFAGQENEDEDNVKKAFNLVIKADTLGSLEAIIGSLEKMRNQEVCVKIVGKGLGNINEDDVNKAEAAGAAVVGFSVKATPIADELMRDKKITFLRYDIIYDLINWIRKELEKILGSEKIITEVGSLKVLAIFRTDKGAMTVGGKVLNGKIKKEIKTRVRRDGMVVGEGKISTCKVGQQEMKEVEANEECGVRFEGKAEIQVGDILEVYTEEDKIKKINF